MFSITPLPLTFLLLRLVTTFTYLLFLPHSENSNHFGAVQWQKIGGIIWSHKQKAMRWVSKLFQAGRREQLGGKIRLAKEGS